MQCFAPGNAAHKTGDIEMCCAHWMDSVTGFIVPAPPPLSKKRIGRYTHMDRIDMARATSIKDGKNEYI